MSAEDIANAFITHYYTTLDGNPSALAGLYVSNPLSPPPPPSLVPLWP